MYMCTHVYVLHEIKCNQLRMGPGPEPRINLQTVAPRESRTAAVYTFFVFVCL